MRECGLKPTPNCVQKLLVVVTPHAGVWIETFPYSAFCDQGKVTPHAGVWIETHHVPIFRPYRGHSPCGSVD